ncbi:demethoxyubiquinone hydroxylase family protein [Rhodospirillaceae bacterium RKSG073]|nr:demethoxyubiquinone hydroxylase family protein [Curvivirga aplysinae]MTI10933.1 demethoxyubiquinone hydroxylase family protein [Curvivirga aplysinae]
MMTETKKKLGPKYLPGDLSPDKALERIIRVDQAGEYGAKRIYQGQIDVLGDTEIGPTLRHMQDQEQEHLDYFNDQLVKRQIRPTALTPFWHVAGWAVGAGTAMMSKEAAMACTVAVEEAIDEHYAEQRDRLIAEDREHEMVETIERFRQEELEHRDIGLDNDAEQAAAYPLLYQAISKGSKFAIWLAGRI